MPIRNSSPPLLDPYLQLPPDCSLTLITSVLGASANWLVLHYLSAVYGSTSKEQTPYDDDLSNGSTGNGGEDVVVVLVSLMRDETYWSMEAKRTVGLDLRQLQRKGRFAFIDGLTQLFAPAVEPRGPFAASGSACLTASTLDHFRTTILNSINFLKSKATGPESRVVLILDSPHILLQTTPLDSPITSTALLATLLQVRSRVHSTLVIVPADDPFLVPAAAMDLQQSSDATLDDRGSACMPLETETAAFVVGLVHQSRLVMGCRRLGTGWADDVSGVLRVTGGAGDRGDEGFEGGEGKGNGGEEGEWLYHIKADGSVRVWGRGATS